MDFLTSLSKFDLVKWASSWLFGSQRCANGGRQEKYARAQNQSVHFESASRVPENKV
jgi:hypothetical protein